MKNRNKPKEKVRYHFARKKITRALVLHGETVSIHIATTGMKLQFI